MVDGWKMVLLLDRHMTGERSRVHISACWCVCLLEATVTNVWVGGASGLSLTSSWPIGWLPAPAGWRPGRRRWSQRSSPLCPSAWQGQGWLLAPRWHLGTISQEFNTPEYWPASQESVEPRKKFKIRSTAARNAAQTKSKMTDTGSRLKGNNVTFPSGS